MAAITEDYKEKLKEALNSDNTDYEVVRWIEKNFPELKESEDERMRNAAINACKYMVDNFENSTKQYEEAIAWLEKQGEHANFLNKIQVGDKVTRNQDGMLVNLSQLNRVAKKDEKQGKNNMGISEATKQKLEDNLNKALEKETPESWNEFLDEQGEHKPQRMVSAEAKEAMYDKPAWSEEDEDILNTIINHFKVDIGCTDEDDIVRWLKFLKDRVQPKQEWSDEDKKMLVYALDMIEWYSVIDKSKSRQVSDWLKSLKERYTWRPSDNELEVLRLAAEKDGACLMGLYEQLKKLREE